MIVPHGLLGSHYTVLKTARLYFVSETRPGTVFGLLDMLFKVQGHALQLCPQQGTLIA
jgi:hypothetical protein